MLTKDWKTPDSDILADHYVNEPKPIRVVVLGAGIAGIAFTYLVAALENVSFTIYEKNPDAGGTWLECTYPGVSCDVPAHCYSFTWAGYVAPG
jgi:cation diffusion facilitator CzcD-associated flavoprotein CzcO